MEIRNDSHVYNLSDAVGRSQVYNMYLCATETGRQCLLLIASLIEQNGALDRIAYILRELKARADEVEKEYEVVKKGEKHFLNYDLEFPEVVDSFVCHEQGDRRIVILAFRNVEEPRSMVPLSNITAKDRRRVDLKTSAWILGKLLKLLVFAHSEEFAVGQMTGSNILIEPEKHYVVVFDWALTQICPGGIPIDQRRQNIAHAARSIVLALGGDPTKGIPDDPGCKDGFVRYADHILRLARGSESNAQRAHAAFYDLVEQIWGRKFHKFTTFPL